MFTKELRKSDILNYVFPEFYGITHRNKNIAIPMLLLLCDKVSKITALNINCYPEKTKDGETHLDIVNPSYELFGLRQFVFLNTLRLWSDRLTDIYFKEIRKLKRLTTLEIKCNHITNLNVQVLGHLKKLKHLSIKTDFVSNVDLTDILNLPNLITLSLDCQSTIPINVNNMNGLLCLTHLKLINCGLTNHTVLKIFNLQGLTHLNISGNQVTDYVVEYTNKLNKLIELNISQTLITCVGMNKLKIMGLKKLVAQGLQFADNHILSINALPNLIKLDLSHCVFNDYNIKMITNNKARFSTILLEELNLSHTAVTDSGIQYIKRLDYLTALDVSYTTITSKHIYLLKLTKLCMHRNPLNMIDVKKILNIKSLQYLDIKCCNVPELRQFLYAYDLKYINTDFINYSHRCSDMCYSYRDEYFYSSAHYERLHCIFLASKCNYDNICHNPEYCIN